VPLAIALDQENGGVNSLFDDRFIGQFPSAMGIAATGSLDMAYEYVFQTGDPCLAPSPGICEVHLAECFFLSRSLALSHHAEITC